MRQSHPIARSLLVSLVAAAALGAAGAGSAHADPIEVPSGKVILPLTGLAIDLPKDKRKGAVWALSGSWSFTDNGASFDARDVIDQKVDGKLVAGTWVHIGYFNAGDCSKVVQELDVPDRWTAERDLWGHHWNVAGGTWDFGNDLGKAPVLALCAPRPNRASLLLYRFFVGDKDALDQEARMALITKDALLDRVTKAWEKDATGPVKPMQRPELKRRGDIEAARTVHLEKSAIDVALPSDGFAWIVRGSDAEAMSDYLDRMAPSVADISLEIARAPGMKCDELFATTGPDAPKRKDEPAPKNIPDGWKSLGTMVLDAALERIVCRDSGPAALVVGVLATPTDAAEVKDFTGFAPLLAALAAGSDAKP
ncbi:MAG: hypothetical protein U1F43_13875 [Myxococcota bacterium]